MNLLAVAQILWPVVDFEKWGNIVVLAPGNIFLHHTDLGSTLLLL
jgi:hypothetical protein